MERHGLPYPYNLHLLVPMMQEARGGTLVTGLGGDQAFNEAGRALDVLARRTRPVPRDLLRIGIGLGPRALRRAVRRDRDAPLNFPWLAPVGSSVLAREWLEEDIRRPFFWDATVRQIWRSRFMQVTVRRIEAVGTDMGVRVCHPFAEWEFIDALAAEVGRTGLQSRTAAMTALFRDALPPELLNRPTKASFNDVLWSTHAQEFATELNETRLEELLARLGVHEIVDPRRLAAHWSGHEPLANSFLLLQACWLKSQGT
jgi:asparagine synthase (glutamine-hydrolysing)